MSSTKQYIVKRETTLLDDLTTDLSFSRSNAKTLLTHELISINDIVKTKHDYQVKENDVLKIGERPIQTYVPELDLPIIYEDDDFIAINKPCGLLSISTDDEKFVTAYRMVNDYVKSRHKDQRIFILHRIDRETSGVLVFCKNEELRNALQENWNDIVTKRGYYAVVKGEPKEKEKIIVNYLKTTKNDFVVVTSNKDRFAQKAITEYRVLRTSDQYSLLDVNIKTGRRNQIRVTLNDMGHPIVNDNRYGKVKSPLRRLGLHAYQLSYKNPINGKEYTFKTVMPQEFKKVLNNKSLTTKRK